MPSITARDGTRIHYVLAGPEDGVPTLLVHGFASDYTLNWVGSRWQEAMTRAGRLVVGPDLRGHGASDKPHSSQAYDQHTMARDLIDLLDHLEIREADYVGYSMGARLGVHLMLRHGDRLGGVVLGGLGFMGGFGHAEEIARRLRGESVDDPVAETFRRFAEARPVNDLEALADCILGPQHPVSPAGLGRIRHPVLLVTGDRDELAADSREVAAAIPGARYLELPGRDHTTAVTSREFKHAAIAFLEESQTAR